MPPPPVQGAQTGPKAGLCPYFPKNLSFFEIYTQEKVEK